MNPPVCIEPAFSDNNISILLSANENFVCYSGVLINSIIEHASSSYNYDIVIMHTDVSLATERMMCSMAKEHSNVSIRFVNVSNYVKQRTFFTSIKGGRLTQEAYFRLFAGDVLSKRYSKTLYLDGDMVALTDVASLWTFDLKGKLLAAVRDISGISFCHRGDSPALERLNYRTEFVGLKNPDDYFISGLMLIDLHQLRLLYPTEKLVQIALSREWLQHDQDVLNYICADGKAKLIHARWNVLQDFGNNRYLPEPLLSEWLESERSPLIVHYGGSAKPWNSTVERETFFWSNAVNTPFFKTIVQRMLRGEIHFTDDEMSHLDNDIEYVERGIRKGAISPKRDAIIAAIAKRQGARSNSISTDNPLVSIIIPVYNTESYLPKCLKSVINQTYRNLEIIIVDDGSTDQSAAICDQFAAEDARIKVIHKRHEGVAIARNTALTYVRGDFIGWVDSDDWISCDMYERLVGAALSFQTAIVMSGFITADSNGFRAKYRKHCRVLTTREALQSLLKNASVRSYLTDKLFRRWIFEGEEFHPNTAFEDTKMMYRLFEKSQWITVLHRPGYIRQIRTGSITQSGSITQRIEAFDAMKLRWQDMEIRWPDLKPFALRELYRSVLRLRNVICEVSEEEFLQHEDNIGRVTQYLSDNRNDILVAIHANKPSLEEFELIQRGDRDSIISSHPEMRKKTNSINPKNRPTVFLRKKLNALKKKLKSLLRRVLPSYRASRRLEKKLNLVAKSLQQSNKQLERQNNRIEKRLQQRLDNRINTLFWLQNIRPGETMEESKQRFFHDMPRWGGDVSRVQSGNLYLLRKLKDICAKHDLSFWLVGGTLLGAVRHKGFIPWDDDIDVGILRDDLERLTSVVEQEYPDLKVARYYHSPGPWQVVKLTLSREDSPFWIDLLQYDYAGDYDHDESQLWELIQAKRKAVNQALSAASNTLKKTYRDEEIIDQVDRDMVDRTYGQAILQLPPVTSKDFIYRSLDCVSFGWQRLFPCNRMMPFTQLEFEGDRYNAPKDYDWYLSLQYGDIYSIPSDVGVVHSRFTSGRIHNAEDILADLRIELLTGENGNDE